MSEAVHDLLLFRSIRRGWDSAGRLAKEITISHLEKHNQLDGFRRFLEREQAYGVLNEIERIREGKE